MSHATRRDTVRPVWVCACGSEWRGDCRTCPTVRIKNNARRRQARRARNAAAR